MRIEHNGTNFSQHNQIVHNDLRLQVARGDANLTKRAVAVTISNKQLRTDEKVGISSCKLNDEISTAHVVKKCTVYNIIHRTWDLKDKREFGLN